MMKNRFRSILTLAVSSLLTLSFLTGCSGNQDGSSTDGGANNGNDSGNVITVQFWTAPQVVQYNYWEGKVQAFNETKTKVGDKIVKLEVQQMPESPSSEAGIQNAIATGTVPVLSENINRGFAATLANSDAVYDLKNEEWFQNIVADRGITDTMNGWEIGGGQYVLPIYANPMIYQWNMNALRAMGIDKPPVTVEEFTAFVQAFRDNKQKLEEIGVLSTFYRPSLGREDQWWDRWFDFQMQYSAFSGGKGWVENNELVLDEAITREVFELYGLLGDTIEQAELSTQWSSDDIPFVFSINAPWEIQMMQESGKKYGLDGDYVYGSPILKNAGDNPYCFGDSKGIVLYQADNITDEMHEGAVAFLQWVYNKENTVETDLDWLKSTNMLPLRGDLTTNETFQSFLSDQVELAGLGEYLPYTVPAMASDQMSEIQGAFTEYGFAPYFEEVAQVAEVKAPNATEHVKNAFDAMLKVME